MQNSVPTSLAWDWQRQDTAGVAAGLEVALELIPYRRDQPVALNKTDLVTHGRQSATRYVHKMVLYHKLHARLLKTSRS